VVQKWVRPIKNGVFDDEEIEEDVQIDEVEYLPHQMFRPTVINQPTGDQYRVAPAPVILRADQHLSLPK